MTFLLSNASPSRPARGEDASGERGLMLRHRPAVPFLPRRHREERGDAVIQTPLVTTLFAAAPGGLPSKSHAPASGSPRLARDDGDGLAIANMRNRRIVRRHREERSDAAIQEPPATPFLAAEVGGLPSKSRAPAFRSRLFARDDRDASVVSNLQKKTLNPLKTPDRLQNLTPTSAIRGAIP